MNRRKFYQSIACALFFMGGSAFGQGPEGDQVTVPLSDPARPALVRVHLTSGGITVNGYSGRDVLVEARARAPEAVPREGPRSIPIHTTGLTIEEENNTVRVGAGGRNRPVDVTVQVPFKTSLKLKCVNQGNIHVEQVQGEIEADNSNGSVTLRRVSGAVVAHALNGRVTVTFIQVDPQKPMSFSSLNGTIDVTFPPDVRAHVKMSSDHGDIYSDFDIHVEDAGKPIMEDSRRPKGRYRVRLAKTLSGTINGGGPEMQFKNFNGNIYIRKATQ